MILTNIYICGYISNLPFWWIASDVTGVRLPRFREMEMFSMKVHLTKTEAMILELLQTLPEEKRFGLGMLAADPNLKKGTVYVLLGRLGNKGYVTDRVKENSPTEYGKPRRFYTITPLGRDALTAWVSHGKSRRVALGP